MCLLTQRCGRDLLPISPLGSHSTEKTETSASDSDSYIHTQVNSAVKDPDIPAVVLNRAEGDQEPAVGRLPPEILIEVASYLKSEQLVPATHVCRFWRWTLISSPRLWANLAYANEQRALVFLERSKPFPVSVKLEDPNKLPGESWGGIVHRMAALDAANVSYLNQLLIQPLPALRKLHLSTSWRFPFASHTLFRAPNLTNFRFIYGLHSGPDIRGLPKLEADLLDFLRGCPLLEVIFLHYNDYLPDTGTNGEFGTNRALTKAVSLRSFSHKSPAQTLCLRLFNQLSLPPTCRVAFEVKDGSSRQKAWIPTLRNPSYFSDVKVIEFKFSLRFGSHAITFINSQDTRMLVHMRRRSRSTPSTSVSSIAKFLRFLESSEITRSVESLHFENCRDSSTPASPLDLTKSLSMLGSLKTIVFRQCNSAFFLKPPPPPAVWCPRVENLEVHLAPLACSKRIPVVLERVLHIAMSRKEYGIPLNTVTLYSRDVEGLLVVCGGLIEMLRSCVNVEFV